MPECPHIEKCRQNIPYSDFFLCMGEVDYFDQDECFEYNDLGDYDPQRQPPRLWKKEKASKK